MACATVKQPTKASVIPYQWEDAFSILGEATFLDEETVAFFYFV
jgi:hypothetical protein